MRTCGDCTLCCKVMGVTALDKPRNQWCQHCTKNKKSCAIYDERPDDCRRFDCLWLKVETLPEELRPDRCGFVLTSIEAPDTVEVHLDPTSARLDHRRTQVIDHLKQRGFQVVEYRGDEYRPHTLRVNTSSVRNCHAN